MSRPRIPVIDLKRQYRALKDETDAAITRVVESGYFIGGPEVAGFEKEFATYCGASYCVGVGSGTAALNLALRGLGVGPGDEVVTVAFTLSATLDAIVATGAKPVLVDVDAATYTMDATLLSKAITPATKAILPVHIYGHPADMDAILAVAARYELPVLGDAAEAQGATYKGKQVAGLGTAAGLSFYPTKTLNAYGDAGGVVTSDDSLAQRIRVLSVHGWDRRFHSAVSSMNSRMDAIQAAVLRTHLPYLDTSNNRRRVIARSYDDALRGSTVIAAPHADWADPCYYLYVLATKEREKMKAFLAEEDIAFDVYWPEPLHLQPAFEDLGYGTGSLPVSERLCDEVLAVALFPEMTDEEVGIVSDALGRFAAIV